MKQQGFLPASKEELIEQGIEQPDFVYVIGDAYVDHPSFGPAIISRVLESHGGHPVPAGLEESGQHPGVRRTQTGFSGIFGKYGLHGKPLLRIPEAQKDRRLYPRRSHGTAARSGGYGLQQSDPSRL